MNRKTVLLPAGAMVLMLACLLLDSGIPLFAQASATPSAKECPYVLEVNRGLKVEIVDVLFTDEIQGVRGNRMKVPEDKKDKMRFALVTIKITKPAKKRLTLAAADLTLHYYHGDQAEVAPCEGISYFSIGNDTDRPMDLSQSDGPGFVKQTTGAKCTKSEVVYLDGSFAFMEPDTREVWICIGQPVSAEPFRTKGWKP